MLNFGLAKEQYAALHPHESDRVKFLIVGDDVAVGRQQGKIVGRRYLPLSRSPISFNDPLIEVSPASALCTRLQAHSLLEEALSTRFVPSPRTLPSVSARSEWDYSIVMYAVSPLSIQNDPTTPRFPALRYPIPIWVPTNSRSGSVSTTKAAIVVFLLCPHSTNSFQISFT